MKVSINWLKEFVLSKDSAEKIAERFTLAGLEVDSIELAAKKFSNIVVGEIVEVARHPDADKLTVCKVNVGKEILQIVCGAKNVAEGIKVPAASVGAVLDGDFKIKKSKLRGVESLGMLCAKAELGLESESEGLMVLPEGAKIGQDIRDYLELDDEIIEIELTPNRGDCASILGAARDLAAITGDKLVEPSIDKNKDTISDIVKVNLLDENCFNYHGRVIKDVNVDAKTPLWMSERLRRTGVNGINIVVDILNYVMLELGQPMHAFDLDKLSGDITVRLSKNESIELLNGDTAKLDNETLVIADDKNPQAIAGVMGGNLSSVTTTTKNLFLESALFSKEKHAGTARKYSLHTDSSYRFERGVDPKLQELALERATNLIIEFCGGSCGPITATVNKEYAQKEIKLRLTRIKRILGIDCDSSTVADILTRLNITYSNEGDTFTCYPPSYRYDLSEEVDLIEEVIRLVGFDKLEDTYNLPSNHTVKEHGFLDENRVRFYFQDKGYNEAISYSFTSKEQQELFYPSEELLELVNPISSDMAVMRYGVWPSLVATAKYNQARAVQNIKLFEVSRVFKQKEEKVVSGLICGSTEKTWLEDDIKFDFYKLKADIVSLFALSNNDLELRLKPCEHSALHPGQSANVYIADKLVGYIGAVHPRISQKMNLGGNWFLFELNLSSILKTKDIVISKPSKFPTVSRDLALVVNSDIFVGDIVEFIQHEIKDFLKCVSVFDVYTGEGVKQGSKSIGLSLVLGLYDRTLTDDEVDKLISNLCYKLTKEFDAALRD